MRRLAPVQLGLLAGLGLAFVGGQPGPATAGGDCPLEEQCEFRKPNFMIVLDYSSSMNEDFVVGQSRWEAAIEAIDNVITTDNGFFDESMHLGLIRFGHDPDPSTPGTTITAGMLTDMSGIVDGTALDVEWYDAIGDPQGYYECNGQAILDFLDNVDPPLCDGSPCSGIGTWTYGGLDRARSYIAQTRADHAGEGARSYFVLLMTDGLWSVQTGGQPADPDTDPNNPVNVADPLFNEDDVPVYVVAFGDAVGSGFADEVALAGGTDEAIEASVAGELEDALQTVVEDIQDQVITPECTGGMPRVMVILDASSSMLNVGDPDDPDAYQYGAEGDTPWDQARDAIAGTASLFDILVPGVNNQPVEDLVHLGLITFGADGEEQVIVDYGPCMKDNLAWALDPETSCAFGCGDPWGGPPIQWTVVGPGHVDYPGFDQATYSVMPNCDQGLADLDACVGSATMTHRGLELANENAQAYRAAPPALYPANSTTPFANILITDGLYQGYSTDAQVSSELIEMYGSYDTITYVVGFGDDEALSTTELGNMACWGSGGSGIPCVGGSNGYYTAATQDELADVLQQIVAQIEFDPCCGFNDCSFNPEPTTGEPDPEPTGSGTGDSGGETDETSMGLTSGVTGTTAQTSGGDAESGPASSGGADGSSSEPSTSGVTAPATSDPTTSPPPPTTVDPSGETTAQNSDTDTDTEGAGAASADGCGCTVEQSPSGLFFGLLGLCFALRRRRRMVARSLH